MTYVYTYFKTFAKLSLIEDYIEHLHFKTFAKLSLIEDYIELLPPKTFDTPFAPQTILKLNFWAYLNPSNFT